MTMTIEPDRGRLRPQAVIRGPVAELGISTANGASGTKRRVLHGIMVPFNEWIEIDSFIEGHFLELFLPGSMDKTFSERRATMRCILHHGKSGTGLGKMPIGKVIDLHANQAAAYYEVELFGGLPHVLLDGFEAGEYGTSVKYECVIPDYRSRPGKAEHNPNGLDELRVVEAKVIEFGPTPFPLYEGTPAGLRSMTDDALLAELAEDPERMAAFAERAGLAPIPSQYHIENRPNANPVYAVGTTSNTSLNAFGHTEMELAVVPDEEPQTTRRYERAAEFVETTVWAMHPAVLAKIVAIIGERKQGYRPTAGEINERIGERAVTDEPPADSPVAVLPLRGSIVPHADMFSEVSGASSIAGFQRSFRDAMANDNVTSVLIDVDSPGGSVDLVPELAAEIRDARGTKPIVAIANTFAASAAYWIAAAADELVVSPSAQVGSIGVYTVHDDISAMQEQLGVHSTLISAGKYKVEGNPFEPLGDEAQAEMQDKVDAYYKMFVSAVAKGRNVSVKQVESDFGQGRMVLAEKAVERGMADRVATFGQTLARLEKSNPSPAPERAAALDVPEPEPTAATTPADPSRSTRAKDYLAKEVPEWHL